MYKFLDRLNSAQKKAVLNTDGPLLILAGAGSGKTTVLVNRIAYILLEKDVMPYNILAITFTNKAANEMKNRIESIFGAGAKDMWISTFHSMCVKILRRYIDRLGYGNNFVIYDTLDSVTVMKQCIKELGLSDKNFPPKMILSSISKAKDELIGPDSFEKIHSSDFRMSRISKAYSLYQKKLKGNNALDFDDLIVKTVELFLNNPDILEKYQNQFKYILVDEYQDTNNSQYMLISKLAAKHKNLCVVGDDDQSIYKFRGANIRNILEFEKDFKNAAIIKLEQNYRSTQVILDAANNVISNNRGRKGKKLWTSTGHGDKIFVYKASDQHDEGRFVAQEIDRLVTEGKNKYGDFVILYRTNAQSRVVEEMLLKQAVPYRVLSGQRFYDRKEIKDIIAYLRVVSNTGDNISLQRIINEPKRGIGKTTIDKILEIANKNELSFFDVISNAEKYQELQRVLVKLISFTSMINKLIEVQKELSLKDFVLRVLEETGYTLQLIAEDSVESQGKIENLNEFISVVAEYQKNEEDPTLFGFLESVSLVADIDNYDEDTDSVVLMTIHSAKGLEFPVVFLVGLEEGLFPGIRAISNYEEIEEERRLCYVAITRAKQKLYITHTFSRMLYGQTTYPKASRFLIEVPKELLIEKSASTKPLQSNINNFADIGSEKVKSAFDNASKSTLFNAFDIRKSKKPELDFSEGDRVLHKKFGQGVIISVVPLGNDKKIQIKFDNGEIKNLMAMFANLKKL